MNSEFWKQNLRVFSLIETELSDIIVVNHKFVGHTGKCCHTRVRQHNVHQWLSLFLLQVSFSQLFFLSFFFNLDTAHTSCGSLWNSWPQLALSHQSSLNIIFLSASQLSQSLISLNPTNLSQVINLTCDLCGEREMSDKVSRRFLRENLIVVLSFLTNGLHKIELKLLFLNWKLSQVLMSNTMWSELRGNKELDIRYKNKFWVMSTEI